MKHLRFLLLSLMTALFASNAMAEKTGKILWDESKSTIVFVYDEMNYEKDGTFITHDTEYTITSIFSLSLSNDNSTESSGPLSDFSDKTSVTTAVFDKSFADARPYCTNYWFSGLQNLTEIVDIKYLNTSETREMLGMFEGCSSLESVDLTYFNTEKVTTMEKMFYQCTSLKMIDVSSFVTTELANTIQMFASCSALETIYCGDAETNWWYHTNLKKSDQMFSGCTNLKAVYGNYTSNWEEDKTSGDYASALNRSDSSHSQVGYFTYATAKVLLINDNNSTEGNCDRSFIFVYDAKKYETGSTQYTFNGTKYALKGVYTLDITKSYDSRFSQTDAIPWNGIPDILNNYLKSVIIDQSFANARPKSTQYWFSTLPSLTNIVGLEYLNTSHVTSMQGMFYYCNLDNLDLSSFNTENVTDMSWMFSYCYNLKTLNLTSFNTSNVTTMASMFNDCRALSTVDLTGFNTEKLTTMESMFSSCYALPTIDLNNFNTAEVTTMADMFSGCTGLVSFDLSKFDITKLTNTSSMFNRCSALETILCGKDTDWSGITSADNMFKGCSKLVGSNGTTSLACDGENNVGATYAKVCTDGDGYFTFGSPKVLWDATNKTLIFAFGGKNYTEYKAGETTYTITKTYPLDITTSYETTPWKDIARDVQKVIFDDTFAAARPVSTARWFKEMRTLTSIEGIQNLNTSEVIDMAEMFYNCKALTSLDLSSFNTAKVTTMAEMFYNCLKLSSLTFGSDFNTAKVTTMYRMFYSCSALSTLDLSNFNTAKVTTMEDMFSFCYALSSLDLSKFNTAKVTTMKSMFFYCKTLTSLNLTSFNTANVTDMESMFQNCLNLGTLDLSSFNTANVTTMKSMFNNCEALTQFDLSSFNTANVTTMESMFDNCKALLSLTLGSNFDTAKVTTMLCMFRNCSSLGTLDVSGFNTANVTTMQSMFEGCKALTSLVLSNFDTAKVTSMSYMFNACEALTSLDLSKFNTAKVTTMLCMFEGCSKLAEINMSNFDTSEVTVMMSMFSKCGKLEELDLTSFTDEKLTDISYMFQECTSLKTIYCSAGTDWSGKKADYTFIGCSTKLTGKYNGKEFAWSENNVIDGTYAKVCTTDEDGYFTNPNPNYTQTVTDAMKATLYLDYPAKIPERVLVYYCTGLKDDEAVPTTTAKQISGVIPAKTGVFVVALAGDYTYAYSTETPATVTDNILTGSVEETTPEANSVLTLGHKENDAKNTLGFWYFTGEKIPANRAWIPASVYENGLESGVKIVFPDDTDGIQEIEMADGQQGIFDLQGRKMASNGNLPRGIYVVNGRKMVIK